MHQDIVGNGVNSSDNSSLTFASFELLADWMKYL